MKTSHLNALRAFEAVLRLGNFRAAADALNVTPAAVGQQIRGLEEFIGRPLFLRSPSGVRPTEEAELLSPKLTLAIRSLSDVMSELTESGRANRVAVSATTSLTENWLSPAIPEFFQVSGEVDLRLNSGPQPVSLMDGSFDFAVRYGPTPSEEFDWIPLFPDLMGPMCTADFARRYDLKPGVGRLAGVLVDFDFSLKDIDPEWLDWPQWCAHFEVEMPERPVRTSVGQPSFGLGMARSGIALVMASVVTNLPALSEGLVILPFGPDRLLRGSNMYRLVWAKERQLSKVQRGFRDWVEERAQRHRKEIASFLGQESLTEIGPATR